MLDRFKRMFSRQPARSDAPPPAGASGPVVVLGQQFAAAREADKRHRAQHADLVSPLGPNARYGPGVDAGDFVNLTPCQADAELAEFCDRFAHADDAERGQLRDSLSMDDFYTLLSFSKRCCVLARRDNGIAHLAHASAAIAALDAQRLDPRDVLVALAFLRDAALALNHSPEDVFQAAIRIAQPAVADLLRSFLRRPAAIANLRAMGYTTIQTSAGPTPIASGFDAYAPTVALGQIALELCELLRGDKYSVTPTLARTLPAVWLRSVDDETLKRLLGTVRAGASIQGTLRAGESPDHLYQMILLFVVELPNATDVEQLLGIAHAKIPTLKDIAMEGFVSGRIFCLLIARSVMQGKAAYETRESIKRFVPGIEQILKAATAQST